MTADFTQLIQYDVTENVLLELEAQASVLKINGIDDKLNYNLVDQTRKEAKRLKVEVERRRKDLKADALAFGKLVDKEAEKYSSRLIKIETQLQEEQFRIDSEKERVRVLNERIKKLPERKLLLSEFEQSQVPDDETLLTLDELDFQYLIQELVGKRQEKIRLEQEAERQKLEEEKKKLEQAAADALKALEDKQKAEMKANQEKVDAELKKLEQEKKQLQEEKDKLEKEAKDKKDKELAEERAKKLLEDMEKEKKERMEKDAKINEWKTANSFDPTHDLIEEAGDKLIMYKFVGTLQLK